MHTVAINEQGAHIHLEGESLRITCGDRQLKRIRLGEIDQLLLLGAIEISSAALAVLARRGIDVVFLTRYGYFRARLIGPGSRSAALRLAQLRRALEPSFCASVAGTLIAAKITHQRQLLLRAQRRLQDLTLAEVLGALRLLADDARREQDLERLLGLEGRAAALYFGQFSKLLRAPELAFHGRSRRPPRDPVNACLSFGYTLLGRVIETEVQRAGLDTAVGLLHQPAPNRPSLALDLLDEFRPFVDALVLRLVNRRQLGPLDFEQHGGPALDEILAEVDPADGMDGTTPADPEIGATGGQSEVGPGIYLADVGRRVFLTEFFQRLREPIYYPPRQGAFELRDIIREQVYHLARVIEGRDSTYLAFVPN